MMQIEEIKRKVGTLKNIVDDFLRNNDLDEIKRLINQYKTIRKHKSSVSNEIMKELRKANTEYYLYKRKLKMIKI